MPDIIITTAITSFNDIGSAKIAEAINTPKKGFRKWKAADLVAPIFFTSKNQIRVPNTPGIRI